VTNLYEDEPLGGLILDGEPTLVWVVTDIDNAPERRQPQDIVFVQPPVVEWVVEPGTWPVNWQPGDIVRDTNGAFVSPPE
jgi:hypothetical protein